MTMMTMTWGRRLSKGRALMLSLVLASTTVLQGCDEQIMLTDAALDPGDNCSSFRETISAARRTEMEQQAEAAIAGAVFGAILGAAVAGGDADDRRQGAILGALGGGLAGFSATYYQQLAGRAADADALLASVNSDAGRERQLVTQTGAAARALRDCRRAQLTTLAGQVRAGSIEKSAARAQLATIQTRLAQDNQIISAAFNGIGRRVDAYIDATAATAQVERGMITTRSGPPAATQARAATPNVARAASDSASVAAADAEAAARIDREIDALEVLLG
jgi:outer membrane lipoprotein SlyB